MIRHEELLRQYRQIAESGYLSYHQGALLWRLWLRDTGQAYRKPVRWGKETITTDCWTLHMLLDGRWTLRMREEISERAAS
jgi:hypothetical protein